MLIWLIFLDGPNLKKNKDHPKFKFWIFLFQFLRMHLPLSDTLSKRDIRGGRGIENKTLNKKFERMSESFKSTLNIYKMECLASNVGINMECLFLNNANVTII